MKNRTIIFAVALLLTCLCYLSAGQELGRGGRSIHQVFAGDYGPRTSATLTNVLAQIGTSRWMDVVIDGGTWTISTNVTVPSNVALIYARGSSLSIGAGCTVTVNTVYNEIDYAASYRASSNIYAVTYYIGTEDAATNLFTYFYPANNPSNFSAGAGASTNGFVAVGPITSPAFYGGGFFGTGGNFQASGNLNAAPAGTNNIIYGNNAQIVAGVNNIVSNNNSFAAGSGNEVHSSAANARGYQNKVWGSYSEAAGQSCLASGTVAMAYGTRAKAQKNYSWVWADNQAGTYEANDTNSFNIRAQNGLQLSGPLFMLTSKIGFGTSSIFITNVYGGVALGASPVLGTLYDIAIGDSAQASTHAIAIGESAEAYESIAVGEDSWSYIDSVAIGDGANCYNNGVAVGQDTLAWDGSVSLGSDASSSNSAVAIGSSAIARRFGTAIGASANGSQTNIAIGFGATTAGGSKRIAIGISTTNDVDNSAVLRGTLYLDGGTSIYYRSTFGSGAWTTLFPVARSSFSVTNASTLMTNITYFVDGFGVSNQYYGP